MAIMVALDFPLKDGKQAEFLEKPAENRWAVCATGSQSLRHTGSRRTHRADTSFAGGPFS